MSKDNKIVIYYQGTPHWGIIPITEKKRMTGLSEEQLKDILFLLTDYQQYVIDPKKDQKLNEFLTLFKKEQEEKSNNNTIVQEYGSSY